MNKYEDPEITGIYNKTLKYLFVGSVILYSMFYKDVSYALGFVLGGLVCLINFKLMIKTVKDMLGKNTYSKAFFSGIFCIRLFITVFILWYALESDSVNLFTTVLGMLSVKTVIIACEIIRHVKSLRDLE